MSQISGDTELLSFIEDSKTYRSEILLQLGQPSISIESDRILTYRLGGDEQKGYFIRESQLSWAETKYSLVLVFNPKGILEKHSLVRVQ
jgi:hypothetical protein